MARINTKDFMLEVAKGNVSRHSVVNKFGGNPSSTDDTEEDVWDGGGTYSFPTSATITHIRSAVDSATTRGVTLQVQGLDTNWDLVVQTKATDGTTSTTEVALDTALRRIFRIKVLDADVMDEDLWCGATGMAAATANAIVQAGNNQTLMALYCVPAGYKAYMTSLFVSVFNETGKTPTATEIRMYAKDNENGYAFQLKHADGIAKEGPGVQHTFAPYYSFSEKTDIRVTAQCLDQVGHVHAGFDLILVEDAPVVT